MTVIILSKQNVGYIRWIQVFNSLIDVAISNKIMRSTLWAARQPVQLRIKLAYR